VLATVAVAALSGCSEERPKAQPSAPMTEVTISCPEFADTANKITEAQEALYSGSGGAAAVDTLEAELAALKQGAPADVRAALGDLSAAFRDAQQIMAHPSAEGSAELADLSKKLSADGQKITAYITAKCN
jgi:hypothetical protein